MPDVEPGDVVIVLQQKPHETFVRDGDNLRMEHTVTLTEALCGFSFVVKHLDGRDLIVTHPVGSVLKPGDIKTVENEGMPQYKNPFQKGNLNIMFQITFQIITLLLTNKHMPCWRNTSHQGQSLICQLVNMLKKLTYMIMILMIVETMSIIVENLMLVTMKRRMVLVFSVHNNKSFRLPEVVLLLSK